MAFTINVDNGSRSTRRYRSSRSGKSALIAFAVLFGAFCIYDYSSYGSGVVGASLAAAQRGVQLFFASHFQVRL